MKNELTQPTTEYMIYTDEPGVRYVSYVDVDAALEKLLRGDLEIFKTLPPIAKNVNLCTWVLEQQPELYVYVPPSKITPELIDLVWNHTKFQDGFEYDFAAFLEHTPEELLTKNYVVWAMEYDFRAICNAPVKFLTPDVLHDYVQTNGSNISYVPDDLITLDLCKTALSASDGNAIYNIPKEFADSEMWYAAVQLGAMLSVDDIPEECMTGELRSYFIENDFLDALQIGTFSELSKIEMVQVFDNEYFYNSLLNDFEAESVLDDYPERRDVVEAILSHVQNTYPEAWQAYSLGCDYSTVSGLIRSTSNVDIKESPIPTID